MFYSLYFANISYIILGKQVSQAAFPTRDLWDCGRLPQQQQHLRQQPFYSDLMNVSVSSRSFNKMRKRKHENYLQGSDD